jgi:3-deoxy-D-manno-octulosonic-acid transferase
MYSWYKFLTYLFYPLAPIYLFIRKLRKKEDPIRYVEKLSSIKTPRDEGFLVWIHMASVGEAMSVLPLIDSFIEENKIDKILLTSITISSGKILEKKFNQNVKVVHQFLPLDIPILIRKFLKHWKPNLSIFIDSEIWPNLIFQIDKQQIPLLLVNARITEKTFKRWSLLKNFANEVFKKFSLCVVSNKESEKFLKILGAQNIKNYGNLKFSNIITDTKKSLNSIFINKIKNRKIWCAASTHETEEILCATSHLEVKKKYKNLLTIIIPRHINRIKKIKKDLDKLGLKIELSSNLDQFNEETEILLVDSYGESLKFYKIAKCVFLGKSLIGSLIKDSGQNPIEPAKLGCKIFHGPNVSNFVEIYDYLKKLGITKKVIGVKELSLSLVEEFGKNDKKSYEIAKKIENHGQNIFNDVIIELKKYI